MKKTNKLWNKFKALADKTEDAIRKDAQVLADDTMNIFTKEGEKLLNEIGGEMINNLEADFRKRLSEHIDNRFDSFQKHFEKILDKI